MIATYEFTSDEIETAFDLAGGACECCGKALSCSNSPPAADAANGKRTTEAALRRSSYALAALKTVTSTAAMMVIGATPELRRAFIVADSPCPFQTCGDCRNQSANIARAVGFRLRARLAYAQQHPHRP